MNQKNLLILGFVVIVIVGLFVAGRLAGDGKTADTGDGNPGNTPYADYYDFGAISMAGGVVKKDFTLSAPATRPMKIEKIYTSCMCTTAGLTIGDKKFGPYGMPGHGIVPAVNEVLPAGESATIEAVFDPAAHGPAGIGIMERFVTVENDLGEPVVYKIRAEVAP